MHTSVGCACHNSGGFLRKALPDGFWRQERIPAEMSGSTLGPRGPADQGFFAQSAAREVERGFLRKALPC